MAGFIGALTGLGGGIIIAPILVVLFDVEIHQAMGASLISVTAISSSTTMRYMREGFTNIRIGMLLEVGAVVGGVFGAMLVSIVPVGIISIMIGVTLFLSLFDCLRNLQEQNIVPIPGSWAQRLKLDGEYQTDSGNIKPYAMQRIPLGFGIVTLSGLFSGLLGIRSGPLKVLALNLVMDLPYKVATSTSNFMVGITATASAGVYLSSGYFNAEISFPVLLGVLCGALSGVRVFTRAKVKLLKIIFAMVILGLSVEMIYNGIRGI
jgi:uncharacterized membrane protein YfcA